MKKYQEMHKKDLTIIAVSAIAVTVCFAIASGLIGNLQVALAQSNDTITTTTTTSTGDILAQVNTTVLAISGLMATATGIIAAVVGWLRSKFGDKIVSAGTNEWLQDLFEKQKTLDNSVRDIFKQVLDKHAEIDVVLGVVKNANPELGKRIDEATPLVKKNLEDINSKINHWQEEADKIKYAISPAQDPVTS